MKIYRGFPERLHHRVPYWVEPGALFHVRIALDRKKEQKALTKPPLAQEILDSEKFYEATARWHITLFLLMPDHLHALLSFARDQSMSDVIGAWKRFHARTNHVLWQEGYFDHRLRADEPRHTALSENELRSAESRSSWFMRESGSLAVGDRSVRRLGGSACPKTMANKSPEAQISGGEAAVK
jgi:REP element-mobilizing transposase RayT